MNITKTGSEIQNSPMIKRALLGSSIGTIGAMNLTKERRNTPVEEYGLGPEAHFILRNEGRGLPGGNLAAFYRQISLRKPRANTLASK